jgi:heat shock protein HspQ
MPHTAARFGPGEIISHNRFDYRGVVVDVDPVFAGTEEWYDHVARSRPPKDAPWYHVLVDGSDHMTYVAERHLESASDKTPIDHPLIGRFFSEYESGHYTNPQPIH